MLLSLGLHYKSLIHNHPSIIYTTSTSPHPSGQSYQSKDKQQTLKFTHYWQFHCHQSSWKTKRQHTQTQKEHANSTKNSSIHQTNDEISSHPEYRSRIQLTGEEICHAFSIWSDWFILTAKAMLQQPEPPTTTQIKHTYRQRRGGRIKDGGRKKKNRKGVGELKVWVDFGMSSHLSSLREATVGIGRWREDSEVAEIRWEQQRL